MTHHRSPLHELAHLFHLDPADTETITPVCQKLTYVQPYSTWIAGTKEESLIFDRENEAQIKIYMDGSGYKGNAGVAAVLLRDDRPPKTLKYHLGPLTRNTTFEAEAVALNLGLKLLKDKELPKTATIQIDNQSIIQSLAIYKQRQSHYHFDAAHRTLRSIERKEGGRGGFELKIAWIAAHSGAEGNEMVDRAAKEAAEGKTDPDDRLPNYLTKQRNGLPASLLAMKQVHNTALRRR